MRLGGFRSDASSTSMIDIPSMRQAFERCWNIIFHEYSQLCSLCYKDWRQAFSIVNVDGTSALLPAWYSVAQNTCLKHHPEHSPDIKHTADGLITSGRHLLTNKTPHQHHQPEGRVDRQITGFELVFRITSPSCQQITSPPTHFLIYPRV